MCPFFLPCALPIIWSFRVHFSCFSDLPLDCPPHFLGLSNAPSSRFFRRTILPFCGLLYGRAPGFRKRSVNPHRPLPFADGSFLPRSDMYLCDLGLGFSTPHHLTRTSLYLILSWVSPATERDGGSCCLRAHENAFFSLRRLVGKIL